MFNIPFVIVGDRAFTNVDIEFMIEALNIDDELMDMIINISTEYGADYNDDYIIVSREMINSQEYNSFLRLLNCMIVNLDVNDIDINVRDDDNDLFVSSIIYDYGIAHAQSIHVGADFNSLFDDELMNEEESNDFKRDIIQGFINVIRAMNGEDS